MAVQSGIRYIREDVFLEFVSQTFYPSLLFFHIFICQFTCLAEAHYIGHVFCACPLTVLMVASHYKGLKFYAAPNIQGTHTLWGMKLMTGKREQVYSAPAHIQRQLAHRLDRITMEYGPFFLYYLARLLHRENNPCLVVGVHNGYYGRVVPYRCPQLVKVKKPLVIYANLCELVAFPSEILAQVEDCRVFHACGNYMSFLWI